MKQIVTSLSIIAFVALFVYSCKDVDMPTEPPENPDWVVTVDINGGDEVIAGEKFYVVVTVMESQDSVHVMGVEVVLSGVDFENTPNNQIGTSKDGKAEFSNLRINSAGQYEITITVNLWDDEAVVEEKTIHVNSSNADAKSSTVSVNGKILKLSDDIAVTNTDSINFIAVINDRYKNLSEPEDEVKITYQQSGNNGDTQYKKTLQFVDEKFQEKVMFKEIAKYKIFLSVDGGKSSEEKGSVEVENDEGS